METKMLPKLLTATTVYFQHPFFFLSGPVQFMFKRKTLLLCCFMLFFQLLRAQGPGNAIYLDGDGEIVYILETSGNSGIKRKFYNILPYTFEAWVNTPNEGRTQHLFYAGDNANISMNASGKIVFSRKPGSVVTLESTNALVPDRWSHVAVTYDGTDMKIYINGQLDATTTNTGNVNNDFPYSVLLGTKLVFNNITSQYEGASGEYFKGSLDEVRIWTEARTLAQIRANMYTEISNPPASLLRYYKMNASGTGTVTDHSIWQESADRKKLSGGSFSSGSTTSWVESYAMVVPGSLKTTNSTSTGFTANWSAPAAGVVSNYVIEVSTSPTFSSNISGYPKNVSGLTETVSGLTRNQAYFWRVRASKTSLADYGGYAPYQTCGAYYLWVGSTDGSWGANNWIPCCNPPSGSDIYIPAGTPNSPLMIGDRTYSNLTIASGASLNLDSYALNVTGTYSNDGTVTGNGKISLNGTSAQTVTGSGSLTNLEVNNPAGVTLSNSMSLGGLTLASGSIVSLGSNNVTLTGNLSNNGSVVGTGKISMAGSSLQNITGIGSITNLEINNAAGVEIPTGNRVDLTGTLTPTSGTLSSTASLVLKSNIEGTAIVAAGSALGGYVSGNVTVERYIPVTSGRRWQLVTAPLKGSGIFGNEAGSSIFRNWQNDGDFSSLLKGVEIWGNSSAGTYGSTGLVTDAAYGYSMRSYVSNAWVNVTDTRSSNTLFNSSGNKAFALFVTGPFRRGGSTENYTDASKGSMAVTLSATGNLITGDHTPTLGSVSTGHYILIGNPYASPIDPQSISVPSGNASGISNTLWMWDAKQSGSNSLGRYVSFDVSGGVYSNAGLGTGYPNDDVMIQSGQAFFVKATSGSPSVTFRESAKSTSHTTTMFGNNTEKPKGMFRSTLVREVNGNINNLDGAVAFFYEGANPEIDQMDGSKLMNSTDNLLMRRKGTSLVFEHRPVVSTRDTIFLRLANLPDNVSGLVLEPTNFSDMWLEAKLVDNFTGKEMPIKLNGKNRYDFTVNASAPASSGDRFMVVLSRAEASAQLISIDADAKGLAVVDVKWNAPGDRFIKAYEVERSTDGVNYAAIGTVDAGLNNNGLYNYTDNSPAAGENNYRIRAIGINGGAVYSEIALVNLKGNGRSLTVYPNPVVGRMQVFISGAGNAKPYTAKIVDASGRSVWQRSGIASGTRSLDVSTANLKSGVYNLVLSDAGGQISVIKFVKQ